MSNDSPRIPHLASTGYKRDSVNRALDVIRPPTMGYVWVIADHRGSIVCNPATLHDVAVIVLNLMMYWQFLVMFKNLLRSSLIWDILRLSYNYCTTIVRLSYDVVQFTYDFTDMSLLEKL